MIFGSERLYAGDRTVGTSEPGEQLEIDLAADDIPTVLPPTLDKLIHDMDTAPNEDGWLATPEPEQKPTAKKEKPRKAPRKPRRHLKMTVDRREIASILVEIAGIIALSAGFALITVWAGLICLGACLILMGVALTRDPEAP